jgi:hypothetical protein
MAELKTRPACASVTAFIPAVEDRQMRADAKEVAAMMRRATGSRAAMFGYGRYHYRYASGREGEYMRGQYDTG